MAMDELLSHVDNLPKIPKLVQELMDLVNDDDSDINEISYKISLDQVISARVLRLSNSAHFGRGQQISSIDEAVIRLGLGPIRTLVTASALMSSFPNIDGLDLNEFWGTTFEVATLCKQLAKDLKTDQNEAFTAAMLHNIGDLLIYTACPEKIEKIALYMETGKTKPEAQQLVLNTDSAQLGGVLAKNWKFASSLIEAISNQYVVVQGNEVSQLTAIISMAKKMDSDWDTFFDKKEKQAWLNHQLEFNMLGFDDNLIDMVDEVRGNGRELASSLV